MGFDGISAGAGSGAVVVLTDGWGGLNVELSLGGSSPFGSEAVSLNAPVAESVDLVGIVESSHSQPCNLPKCACQAPQQSAEPVDRIPAEEPERRA